MNIPPITGGGSGQEGVFGATGMERPKARWRQSLTASGSNRLSLSRNELLDRLAERA
jgi:hypothetical protein